MKKLRGTVTIEFSNPLKPTMEITNIHPAKMTSLIEEFIKNGWVALQGAMPLLSKLSPALKKDPEEYLLGEFAEMV